MRHIFFFFFKKEQTSQNRESSSGGRRSVQKALPGRRAFMSGSSCLNLSYLQAIC